MIITIVESPYNHPTLPRLECVRYALWCCLDATQRGEAVYASHLLTTQWLPETSEGRDLGLRIRDRLVKAMMAQVARYTDLGETKGMFREIDGTAKVITRQLDCEIRSAWVAGQWPSASVRLAVL